VAEGFFKHQARVLRVGGEIGLSQVADDVRHDDRRGGEVKNAFGGFAELFFLLLDGLAEGLIGF